MRRRHALAALGLIGSGGCLRLANGSTSTTRTLRPTRTTETATTRTATEATTRTTTQTTEPDTETATETSTEPTYPNGLRADGVRESLYPFHLSTLNATSFSAAWSKLDLDESEFKWRKRYETEIGSAVGRLTTRAMGGPADVYRTRNGSDLWRENLGGSYTYGRSPTSWRIDLLTWDVEVRPILDGVVWSAPTRVNDARPAVWEVSAEGVDGAPKAPGHYDGTLRSLSGTLRIDERGFIRAVNVTYQIEKASSRGGGVRSFRSQFAVDGVGSTSVAEPAWASAARGRHPRVSSQVTADRKYVRIDHEGGNRLEPNTYFQAHDNSTNRGYTVRIEEAVEPGETVFLYGPKRDNTSPDIRISRGSRPGAEPSTTFEGTHDVWARRASLLYFKHNR